MLSLEGRVSLLPDEDHRTAARIRAIAPARVQHRSAAPHDDVRAVAATVTVNGAGEIHVVVALAVLDPDGNADVGRSCVELPRALGTAVARTEAEIRGAIVGANPVGS